MANDSSLRVGPPRIVHLLIWMSWSAAIFAFIRAQSQAIGGAPTIIPATYGVLDGGILTGFCIVLWYGTWTRGYLAPGHWMLVAGVAYIVEYLEWREYEPSDWVSWAITRVPWLYAMSIYCLATLRTREPHWKGFFALLTGSIMIRRLLFPGAVDTVEILGLLSMIILDSLWCIRRDWLHWLERLWKLNDLCRSVLQYG